MQLVLFLLAWFIFTAGPGLAITARLTRDFDPLRRVVVALGVGTAAAPVLINVLGRLQLVQAFPYLAVALGVVGLWLSRRSHVGSGSTVGSGAPWGPPSGGPIRLKPDPTPKLGVTVNAWRDAIACAAVMALAVGLGVIVFANRLEMTPEGIVLYGEYDTADLTYYAGEASEASHTIPPMAFYYSGHKLNAAYFPHLIFAMIHRFAKVPILLIYFQYAWPTFLALSAATGFVLVRAIASRGVAVLAVVLVLVGSDFSYLAAWYLPDAANSGNWDYVLWPTNFLSPTMQILFYNTWGLSLPLFFTVLYTIVLGLQTRARGWIVVNAFLLAILFEFRPFAYVVLMGALGAAAFFSWRNRVARWQFVATAALGVLFTTPFLYAAATLAPEDRRTRLVIEFFPLVKRMLIKLGLAEAFPDWVNAHVPWAPLRTPLFYLLATIIFLAVGVGVRWAGAPGVWRAVRGRFGSGQEAAAWSVLGWSVVVGIAIPFVIATEPYVDTLNFYVTGLYVLWIFTAAALVGFAHRHPGIGGIVIATAIAVVLPSSTHYLERRWKDRERRPRVDLSAAEIRIADYLRNKTDPETTVILHDRPLSPSLTTILAERRIVLGWDVTYSAVGGQERLRDVNRFYSSADGNADAAFESLGRYRVTHVIVRDGNRVHPSVLARLHRLMQFPGAALYTVPQTPEP
jgi:hypothetical protein